MHTRHLVVLPTPAFLELFEYERNSPAGFLVDFCEDLQNLFLLSSVSETLSGVSERSEGDRGDTATKKVSMSAMEGIFQVERTDP